MEPTSGPIHARDDERQTCVASLRAVFSQKLLANGFFVSLPRGCNGQLHQSFSELDSARSLAISFVRAGQLAHAAAGEMAAQFGDSQLASRASRPASWPTGQLEASEPGRRSHTGATIILIGRLHRRRAERLIKVLLLSPIAISCHLSTSQRQRLVS